MTSRPPLEHSSTQLPLPPDWPQQVIFRHLERKDLPNLEWEGEYTHFREVYKQVFQRGRLGMAVLWGADLPEVGLIGQAFVQLQGTSQHRLTRGLDLAYIHSFRVRPEFRGYGIGTRLMDVIEEDIRERGFDAISLNVVRENSGALRLYQRLGYEIIGPDPGRWSFTDHNGLVQEVHEPGWRMLKKLDETQ